MGINFFLWKSMPNMESYILVKAGCVYRMFMKLLVTMLWQDELNYLNLNVLKPNYGLHIEMILNNGMVHLPLDLVRLHFSVQYLTSRSSVWHSFDVFGRFIFHHKDRPFWLRFWRSFSVLLQITLWSLLSSKFLSIIHRIILPFDGVLSELLAATLQ
jgi:hypothetical protein